MSAFLWGCAGGLTEPTIPTESEKINMENISKPAEAGDIQPLANVVSVEVHGDPGNYRYSVGIRSPDEGCSQYADWWEVIDEEGRLIYRRILLHSHVNEQPFVRSGGPVNITADEIVVVRAHMNPGGYGGAAMRGSVSEGFARAEPPAGFAPGVEELTPLPASCAF